MGGVGESDPPGVDRGERGDDHRQRGEQQGLLLRAEENVLKKRCFLLQREICYRVSTRNLLPCLNEKSAKTVALCLSSRPAVNLYVGEIVNFSVWNRHNHQAHLGVEKNQTANSSLNPRWSAGWIGRRHTRSFKEPARTDFFQNKTKDERSKPKSKLRDHFKSTSIREEPGHRHEPLVQLGWALNQQEGAKWNPVWELDQITNPARWQNLPCSSSATTSRCFVDAKK